MADVKREHREAAIRYAQGYKPDEPLSDWARQHVDDPQKFSELRSGEHFVELAQTIADACERAVQAERERIIDALYGCECGVFPTGGMYLELDDAVKAVKGTP